MTELEIDINYKNYGKKYSILSTGEVKNKITGKLLPKFLKNGYYAVSLSYNENKETVFIHRMMAYTFLKNYENMTSINHKNANKLNNNINNLEWIRAC